MSCRAGTSPARAAPRRDAAPGASTGRAAQGSRQHACLVWSSLVSKTLGVPRHMSHAYRPHLNRCSLYLIPPTKKQVPAGVQAGRSAFDGERRPALAGHMHRGREQCRGAGPPDRGEGPRGRASGGGRAGSRGCVHAAEARRCPRIGAQGSPAGRNGGFFLLLCPESILRAGWLTQHQQLV